VFLSEMPNQDLLSLCLSLGASFNHFFSLAECVFLDVKSCRSCSGFLSHSPFFPPLEQLELLSDILLWLACLPALAIVFPEHGSGCNSV
jgi:hypothetical protein